MHMNITERREYKFIGRICKRSRGSFLRLLIKEKVLLSRKTVYAKNAGTDRLSVFITNLAGISVPLKN